MKGYRRIGVDMTTDQEKIKKLESVLELTEQKLVAVMQENRNLKQYLHWCEEGLKEQIEKIGELEKQLDIVHTFIKEAGFELTTGGDGALALKGQGAIYLPEREE
jgi:chromosome segregation ATPase